jgi:hypothetical protein
MVTCDPPNNATTTPPTIADTIPALGGMPLAIARLRPRGSAISDTTNPAKIFLCRLPMKEVLGILLLFGPDDE